MPFPPKSNDRRVEVSSHLPIPQAPNIRLPEKIRRIDPVGSAAVETALNEWITQISSHVSLMQESLAGPINAMGNKWAITVQDGGEVAGIELLAGEGEKQSSTFTVAADSFRVSNGEDGFTPFIVTTGEAPEVVVDANIRSKNFEPSESGFMLNRETGEAEFGGVTIRDANFTHTLSKPSISPGSKTFSGTVNVGVFHPDGDATIRYTTDGSDVDKNSSKFPDAGITVSSSKTIKAAAFKGDLKSAQASATYTFSSPEDSSAGNVTFDQQWSWEGSDYVVAVKFNCATSGVNIKWREAETSDPWNTVDAADVGTWIDTPYDDSDGDVQIEAYADVSPLGAGWVDGEISTYVLSAPDTTRAANVGFAQHWTWEDNGNWHIYTYTDSIKFYCATDGASVKWREHGTTNPWNTIAPADVGTWIDTGYTESDGEVTLEAYATAPGYEDGEIGTYSFEVYTEEIFVEGGGSGPLL